MKAKKQTALLELTLDMAINAKWPHPSNSVKEIHFLGKMQKVPAAKRVPLMEEAWRVLEAGGSMRVTCPYYSSERAIQDPCAEWPPIGENSFIYFNKEWRKNNGEEPVKCDFDFTYGIFPDGEAMAKNSDTQAFWVKRYLNAANDIQVTLTKRP